MVIFIVILEFFIFVLVYFYVEEKFKLKRFYPKRNITKWILQFIAALSAWFLALYLISFLPSEWVRLPLGNHESEQCWDKQGTYKC